MVGELRLRSLRLAAPNQYDPAGNLIIDALNRSFGYDAENRQKDFNNSAVRYIYDGDGRRVEKIEGSTTTVFVYNVAGQLVAEYTSGTPDVGGGTTYLSEDHLGSVRLTMQSSGDVKSRHDYLPFGEELSVNRSASYGYVTDNLRQKFTQKERDNESGLDYFGARYYSGAQGRFTSVDPYNIILEAQATADTSSERAKIQFLSYLAAPQQWNRYSYVANNPLRYVDPTGQRLELTGDEDERKASFERIKGLVGPKGAGLLYIQEENGHYYVEYSGKDRDALAATGQLGVVVADVIDRPELVEYRVSYSEAVTAGDGRTVDLREHGGGYTIGLERNGKFDRIQIFVYFSPDMATRAAAAQGAVGDDGRPLVYEKDVADAHEFGHARGFLLMRYTEAVHSIRWWQFGRRDALREANNGYSLTAENMARERRGLNKRVSH